MYSLRQSPHSLVLLGPPPVLVRIGYGTCRDGEDVPLPLLVGAHGWLAVPDTRRIFAEVVHLSDGHQPVPTESQRAGQLLRSGPSRDGDLETLRQRRHVRHAAVNLLAGH